MTALAPAAAAASVTKQRLLCDLVGCWVDVGDGGVGVGSSAVNASDITFKTTVREQ